MAQRRIKFIKGEIYHVVVRAIDGIKLFRDEQDYLRTIHNLFEFNDLNPSPSIFRVIRYRKANLNTTKPDFVILNRALKKKRKLLVEILTFCLMPNHIHLLVRQLKENGITKFMHKFGGYTLYFNKKYKRKGHLFQGRFRAVHVNTNEQLQTAFVYIHTNPVAIIFPKWKDKGINDFKKAKDYIENFRWSSYQDYLEKKNFPSVTNREFMKKVMGKLKNRRKYVNDWLRYKRESVDFDDIVIE